MGDKKRFIAGAVCPRCKEMDVIVVYKKNKVEHRECVNCDFEDMIRFKPKVDELTTRVNKTKDAEEKNVPEEAIKFVDPKA